MKIYHNPRCRKSRETLAILRDTDQKIEVIQYLIKPLSASEIKTMLKKLDMPAEKLIRKSEKIYKEEYKGKDLTEEQWIKAMAKYPILMERPIVIKGRKAVIGRPPENVNDLLASDQ